MDYKIFKTNELVARTLAEDLFLMIQDIKKNKINIAISGGTTPFLLFEILANDYKYKIDWKKIHFFWVDERCVEPTSVVSNFGNTKKVLFDKIEIPKENIHRIFGENEAENESKRYSKEIEINIKNAIFDIVLLGMGDDGHTASIFPTQIELMDSTNIVEHSQNPYNTQNRVTLSGSTINKAKNIIFLITGANKAKIIQDIYKKQNNYLKYPASRINPTNGKLIWYFDQAAFKS
jgi:6-phosphogluconolactonase